MTFTSQEYTFSQALRKAPEVAIDFGVERLVRQEPSKQASKCTVNLVCARELWRGLLEALLDPHLGYNVRVRLDEVERRTVPVSTRVGMDWNDGEGKAKVTGSRFGSEPGGGAPVRVHGPCAAATFHRRRMRLYTLTAFDSATTSFAPSEVTVAAS